MRRFTLSHRRELFVLIFTMVLPEPDSYKQEWFAPFFCLGNGWLAYLETALMKENTQELIASIRRNSELTNEEKSQLINALRKKKRYGIVWEDRKEESWTNLLTHLPVLEEVRERAIISEKEGSPDHILIEGDNIDALVALTYTHEGKIDVIYIDPPYNTGNKDFIYNDSYIDSEDSFRHSKWLSFMEKRLRIAKRLLSDKGVIFISIDDNEQAQLKLLCDEIYGQENFLGLITRKQSSGAKNDTGENRVITTADYIVSYAKENFRFKPYYVKNQKTYTREDNEGRFSPRALEMQGGGDTLQARPRMGYSIYYRQSDNSVKLLFDYDLNKVPVYRDPDTELINQAYECFRPRKRDMALGRWRWGDETFIEMFKHNLVHFERGRVFIKERVKEDIPKYPEAIWNDYLNTQGTNELKEIFGGKTFNFPKPVNFITQLLRVTDASTVLDFFAGSGTTLHATMSLNAEDGGHRQCILVTNNENRICEDVTYIRNKKVIEGYINQKGDSVKGLTANSLRYYRTKYVGREKTVKNGRELALAATELVCIREGAYREMVQFGSLRLKPSVARCFEGKGKLILLIFNDAAIEPLVGEMSQMDKSVKFKIYVLAPGGYAYDDEFDAVADRVELCPIPSSIYNAYEKVLPKEDNEMECTDEPDDVDDADTNDE